MKKEKVIIIGAGPGGLSAGMLLAHHGFEVTVFEKHNRIGGRNGAIQKDGFTFDIGPTFFMMPYILEEIFEHTGRNLHDYMDLIEIDPMYRLRFKGGKDFYPTRDRQAMLQHIEELFPGDSPGYERFMEREAEKFDYAFPCLQSTFSRLIDYLQPKAVRALPKLDLHKSVYDVVSSYFSHEDMRLSMTFQAKYLGMSPWSCPGLFSILPLIEHKWGIFHPRGGLNQIPRAMADVFQEEGGEICLDAQVDEIIIEAGVAKGVRLKNGETHLADHVVLNADFAHAMTDLVPEKERPKYTDEKLAKKSYSCSTYMLYLGLDKQYDIPHHNIIFADDYRENVNDIAERGLLSDDPSIYVQNPCHTDSSLAPAGQSTMYVLVPVANNASEIDWEREGPIYREKVLEMLETKTELKDIREHIISETVITPQGWEDDMHVYKGAVFNLGHNLNQMLYFRPHNKFESFDQCYLVGGGTHPGSGLPTILESGRICAKLLGCDLSQKARKAAKSKRIPLSSMAATL